MMSDSEKLCLQWNEFQKIVSSAFGDLREDKDFTDVTLACEDGKQVEVHKLVLAASSPFFMQLLRRNKHPHPLIYMKGVKSENLMSMLEFFYFGEANVYQENLDTFLAFADELKLKGLNGPDQSKERLEQDSDFFSEPSVGGVEVQKVHSKILPKSFDGTLALNNSTQQLNIQIDALTVRSEKDAPRNNGNGHSNGKLLVCKVCGKEGLRTTIRNHIEAKHINGVSHTCDVCGKSAKTKNSLASHKSIYHRK